MMADQSQKAISHEVLLNDIKHHGETVIDVVSLDRARDFALTTVYYPPEMHDPIRGSLFKTFNANVQSSLGPLDCLPVEVLCSVCSHLDLLSGLRFSHVNHPS
jgi:hypothetical protein